MGALLDYVGGFVAKRMLGVVPNFVVVHECPDCGGRYLCPDRYDCDKCWPVEFWKERGYSHTRMLCSPCAGQYADEVRRVWYEAHGIQLLKGECHASN